MPGFEGGRRAGRHELDGRRFALAEVIDGSGALGVGYRVRAENLLNGCEELRVLYRLLEKSLCLGQKDSFLVGEAISPGYNNDGDMCDSLHGV